MIGKVELALKVWSLPDGLPGLNERVPGGRQGFWDHGTFGTSGHSVCIAST